MNREYLKAPAFTKNGIIENVLAPNNLDGKKADSDISALVRENNIRQFSQNLLYASSGFLLFSLYNVSRLGVLSPSGRTAALGSTAFFTFLNYACLDKMGYFRSSVQVAATPEPEKSQ